MTKIEVKAGDTVTVTVTGPAMVRIGSPGAAPKPPGATMAGLAEAVALVTARRHGIGSPGLSGDVPASAVAAALTILAAAFLGGLGLKDQGAGLLQDLGLAAASEDGGSTGRTTP